MEKNTQSFEDALSELEELVGRMESGEMGLEEMVAAFEKGQGLVKSCTDRLNEVERRIEVIKKNADGAVVTAELPPMGE
ncbi:MAG: exodeoxyribonuclease VII small subunit [Kiritimatiellae bacterium]|nr:exodeoxyribonuclease VII small subunit [Kiritimatiellia bacterium]